MRAKRIEITKEIHKSLYVRFKDDIKVYSCFTLMSEGMLSTTWGIENLNTPFIESNKHWETDDDEKEVNVKWTYYLYIPDDQLE